MPALTVIMLRHVSYRSDFEIDVKDEDEAKNYAKMVSHCLEDINTCRDREEFNDLARHKNFTFFLNRFDCDYDKLYKACRAALESEEHEDDGAYEWQTIFNNEIQITR